IWAGDLCEGPANRSRRTGTARRRTTPTKPGNEQSAKQSAPRLDSRLHFEIVLAFDAVRVIADGMPGNRILAGLELAIDRHNQLRLVVRGGASRTGGLLLAFFIRD